MRGLCIAIGIAMMVSTVHAVECGPLVTQSRLAELRLSLSTADSALDRDKELLLAEAKEIGKRSPVTEATLVKMNQAMDEHDLASSADATALDLMLGEALTLVYIRDVMRDKWDKSAVESHLSITVLGAHNRAELQLKLLDNILMRTSRPGIAVHISKMRDAVAAVVTEFQKCEKPKLPKKK